MGAAIIDGAMRGFNMMERHNARKQNQQRLSMLDERNENRYQKQQERFASIDEKSDNRYQDQLEYRDKTADATKEYRGWQVKKQEADTEWTKDQKMMGVGWDYFRANGQIAPEHEEMFKRNPGYSPTSFADPAKRQQVKMLNTKMKQTIESGQLNQVNSPDTVQLFNSVFEDKIKKSVGESDPSRGTTIKDVNFHGFVPVGDKGEVSFALKVDYENGESSIKPMSQGRSADPKDPPLVMQPKDLIGTIRAKMMMADMIERPEYWDKMGASIAGRKQGKSTNQQGKSELAYRKEEAVIQRDLTNAVAKLQSDPNMMDEDRNAAITRVTQTYEQRKNALAESYGITKPEEQMGETEILESGKASSSPPLDLLTDGKMTKFRNGQVWTIQDGEAKQVK